MDQPSEYHGVNDNYYPAGGLQPQWNTVEHLIFLYCIKAIHSYVSVDIGILKKQYKALEVIWDFICAKGPLG